ncbi:MAG: four helix bundle protein [Clostridiales Family XIII bacterium]|jgi:four helix bundle protein|nr:four helix bundle protein [Clostridiales Family XIII bacterium]
MGNSVVGGKSFDFAVRVVNLYRYLCDEKREFILSKQLIRSGTSIGANIEEALQGQSKRDYLSKMNIALKEANETLYWIRLLHTTGYIDDKQNESIYADCNEIVSLLVSIVKTTKKNLEAAK